MFKVGDELKVRVISGVVLFTAAVFLIALGGPFYIFTLLLLAILCSAELFMILGSNSTEEGVSKSLIIKGVLAIFLPAVSIYIIREGFSKGIVVSFWFFIVVASVDVFAFFSGRLFGKHKIAPEISPNKTWEGLVGGVLLATIFSICFYYFFNSELNIVAFVVMSVIISIVAQVSDFCESFFKRKFNVKDSSNLIPGHGGFLDRLDGYFLTAPLVVVFYFIFKVFFGVGIF